MALFVSRVFSIGSLRVCLQGCSVTVEGEQAFASPTRREGGALVVVAEEVPSICGRGEEWGLFQALTDLALVSLRVQGLQGGKWQSPSACT